MQCRGRGRTRGRPGTLLSPIRAGVGWGVASLAAKRRTVEALSIEVRFTVLTWRIVGLLLFAPLLGGCVGNVERAEPDSARQSAPGTSTPAGEDSSGGVGKAGAEDDWQDALSEAVAERTSTDPATVEANCRLLDNSGVVDGDTYVDSQRELIDIVGTGVDVEAPARDYADLIEDSWGVVEVPLDVTYADVLRVVGEALLVPCLSRSDGSQAPDDAQREASGPESEYADSFANEAFSSGEVPQFPTVVDGYRLSYKDSVQSRAFDFTTRQVFDLPATMNGCGNQRFYVRWRAPAEYAVEAIWTYPGPTPDEPIYEPAGGSATGSAGFMSSYGCTQPAFRLIDAPEPSNLIDVTVEFQVWVPAV